MQSVSKTAKFSVWGTSNPSNITKPKDPHVRMSSIESRLQMLEQKAGAGSSGDNLRNYQAQVLEKLKAIRKALVVEGGDIAKLKEERDAALAENKTLKRDVDRQNYRIQHLIKALNEEEAKSSDGRS